MDRTRVHRLPLIQPRRPGGQASSSEPQQPAPEPTDEPNDDEMGSYFSSEEASPEGSSQRTKHTITETDALAVTAILHHRLPVELISPILDYAQYFPRTILVSNSEHK